MFASSEYVKRVKNLSGVTLPNNRFTNLFTESLKEKLVPKPSESEEELVDGPSAPRTKEFELPDEWYREAIKRDPFGNFEVFELKDTRFFLMGMNYANIPAINLWKMLEWAQPDSILLALPPDEVLPDFKLNPLNPKTKLFSNRMYFDQLTLPVGAFSLNKAKEEELLHTLTKNGAVIPNKPRLPCPRTVENFRCLNKLEQRVPSLASLYSKHTGIPVVLGDMPDFIYRQHLINGSTITQLRETLKRCTNDSVLNPDIQPCTPLALGVISQPGQFLRPSDGYLASLLEYSLHKGKFKRVFAFLGNGQASAVKALLHRRAPIELAISLQPPKPIKDILGRTDASDYVEKVAICDVLRLGQFTDKPSELKFKTTWALLESSTGLDQNDPQMNFYVFQYREAIKKYFALFQKYQQEGAENLKKYYKNVIVSNPDLIKDE